MAAGRFTASAHVVSFLENADYQYGGQADWGTGMGTLAVYLDDMRTPLFIVPLNLDATYDNFDPCCIVTMCCCPMLIRIVLSNVAWIWTTGGLSSVLQPPLERKCGSNTTS